MLKRFWNFDFWTKLVVVFLWLSTLLGKGSAYIGLSLGALLLFSTSALWDRWFKALTRKEDLLHLWSWALLVSLLCGFCELFYGLMQGFPLLTALEILVFNLCPVYVFLGIHVAGKHPGIARAYIRYSAWFAVVYAPLYFLFFNKLHISLSGLLPGNDMNVLTNSGTGSATILGLLAYEPNLIKFWLPLLVLTCLTIANQERSDWLGLFLSLLIWGFLEKKIRRVLGIAGLITAVLVIAALLDLKLPAIPGRGGELSARGTVARMAGAISPDAAAAVGGGRADARFYYGTVYWRKHWWAAIRSEVSRTYGTEIFGMGYGYPLAHLASRDVEKQGTRSPHNILYFCLAYSGLMGVVIFIGLESCMFHILWRVYKLTGQTFGLVFFTYQIVQALFGNSIETPQVGIFVYLFVGLTIAPAISRLKANSYPEDGDSLYEAIPASPRLPELEHAGGD